ncbi:MAG: CPBP family intramembrane metalloprotease [Ruminococcus sp.]|nr:CPBP family intramembrane metalloprotease [Ruminococcus sp.]
MKRYRPKLFDEASEACTSKDLFIIILCFIAVFIVTALLESIFPVIFSWKLMQEELAKLELGGSLSEVFEQSMDAATTVTAKPKIMIPTLFCTVFGIICSLIYCRCIEMRHVRSMGVVKKKAVPNYITGLVIGTVMMSAITFLNVASGTSSFSRCTEINYGLILLYFLGFFVQGMSEEFIFRGYFLTSLGGGGHHTALAVGISSIAFGLAHGGNRGFGIFPFFNLVLFGVFAGLYLILTESIWGISAIHSIWNFTQGNIYGISVSGTGSSPSVFRTAAVSKKAFLTGGEFGIEGSVFTTIVLTAGIIILFAAIHKKSLRTAQPAETEVPAQPPGQ